MARKAMVLTAGLGTRLRPLTDQVPKPLVPIAGEPVVARTLRRLAQAGVGEVVLNLHYRGEQIRSELGTGERFGLAIRYLDEERILGTGGGVRNALGFLGREPFLLINGDAVVDPPWDELYDRHLHTGAAATMLVRAVPDAQRWGAVELDEKGWVRGLLGQPPGRPVGLLSTMFTGVHVIDPKRIGPLLPAEGCIIRTAYRELVPRGEVAGLLYEGAFFDIGTPRDYLEANLSVAGTRVVVDPSAHVKPGAKLDRVVAWAGSRIDADLANAVATPQGVVAV